ncbi:MAG: hypothetical protein JWQ03_935 [Variovorax sp.]|nr:hypothetical protein [Variovorax sp.]
MTEPGPVSFSLLAAAIALLGPVLGPYALVVFAAGVGAAAALSKRPPAESAPRWYGIKFLAMGTTVALLLTGPCIWVVTKYTDMPANIALIPVAFALGLAKTKFTDLIDLALEWMAAKVRAFLTGGQRGTGQ